MKYKKFYRDGNSKEFEVTKDEAKRTLEGYWKPEVLDDIFNNEKGFRLYSPFAIVWTETEDGKVPIAGFYGICG